MLFVKNKLLYNVLLDGLIWASSQTRIDLAFETCCLSTKLNSAKVEDLVDANKALKKLKNGMLIIVFPNLGNLTDLRLVVFADASYTNLPNGASQAGFIIFLANQTQSSCPISWASRKVKRIVKSTLAAETLSMQLTLHILWQDSTWKRKTSPY